MGEFVAGVVAGVPAYSASASPKSHVEALVASCAELSTLARDLRHLSELLSHGSVEAAMQYRASVRQAVREVEQALVQLQATDERGNSADVAVRNFQVAFDAVQARYRGGLASLFELEDARRQLFAAQTARVSLQQERAQAWVSLYRAMGGGWRRADAGPITSTSTMTTTSTNTQ